jgi:ribonuclease HI
MDTQIFLQWNCRGLRANIDEIQILTQHFQPAVFSLQEIKLSKDNPFNLRHYTHFSHNPYSSDTRPHGGVSLLIRKNIPHSQINLNTPIQAVAAAVSCHRPISVCSIYIPPHSSVNEKDLDDLVLQLPSPVLIMGDFNAHSPVWGGDKLDTRGRMIEQFITNNNLCILNNKSFTYIHPASGSQTAIDLTICDPHLFLDLEWKLHNDQCGSDHFPIIIKNIKPEPTVSIARWKFKKADWIKFRTIFSSSIDITSVLCDNDPVEAFTATIIKAATQSIPKTHASPKNITKPWFNDMCKTAIKDRKKALHRFQAQPTDTNLQNYKIQRAITRRTIRFNKRNSWQSYVSQLNSQTPSKKVWDMLRKITGKFTNTAIKHLHQNNTLITDVKQISNTLADTFAKNSSTIHYSLKFQRFKAICEKKQINFTSNNLEYYNVPFSVRELQDALDGSHNTSPGYDEISYEMLKQLPPVGWELLLDIFNHIWQSGKFPSSWHQAIVIPLPKPGKDTSDPNSYRPIALTSCICKTMERMVNSRLVYYLEQNNIITEFQSGFRKQRSTMDQLIRLDTWVREGLANGQHVVAIFFDLEKAYDTTWKYGILSDLFNAGLRGHLPTFISRFLEGREFRVRMSNTYSDLHSQEMGVPQGCVLSVTLFNLKVNSIVSCLTTEVDCSLYVDDFLACCRSKQMRTIERQMQQCLNKLEKWADENGFKFSQSKTVCMHFCHKRKLHPDPLITLNNINIPIVTETKFLGVFFDNKLSYIPHLKYLRAKCLKAMNLLRIVAHQDWGGDTQTLLKLYRCLIRSKLDYGSIVYGAARKSYISMLDPVQNQALRICLGAFRTSPVESLQIEANEPSLALRRTRLSALYILRLSSNTHNPAYKNTFHPQYQHIFQRKTKTIPTFGIRALKLVQDLSIDLTTIVPYRLPSIPPWLCKMPTMCFSLQTGSKASTGSGILRQNFYQLLNAYTGFIQIYTDGSKDGNHVASAMVHKHSISITARLPDNSSIFSAELHGILVALEFIDRHECGRFVIFSDSLSCLQAIYNAKWSNPLICDILEKCHFLSLSGKDVHFCWVPSHVGISGNDRADAEAKAALQLPVSDCKVPHTDLKQKVTLYLTKHWQTKWDQFVFNKLQPIKKTIGVTTFKGIIKRRDEVVLHRVRIGHTHLTHCYLLKAEEQPQCNSCHCALTVKHILIDCPQLSSFRQKYFNASSLSELFSIFPAFKLLAFLREVEFYQRF